MEDKKLNTCQETNYINPCYLKCHGLVFGRQIIINPIYLFTYFFPLKIHY